ncbi:MAG: DEAD/DEAH box helicase family protein [Ardenticatenaceae bacterium]|nr:DEAD/DEAH box helicase family protein [Ardenticatenaceae bacterium]
MIHRYSSRRQSLKTTFLNARLQNAQAYDRIAGYFRSSLLEVAGEAIESISGQIRIVCNSDLHPKDVETARAAQQAMRQEWCEAKPEELVEQARDRFTRLYDLLKTEKMVVRVLPAKKFGLLHGKAGVITLANGKRTSFLGSANATRFAWEENYELLWEDSSQEAIDWVQEEFDALWNSPFAVPLAGFVVEDIGRLSRRSVIRVEKWREEPEPASVAVEIPIFREELGLWEHQKYFVQRAFKAHRESNGARFLLADQVGLGKTVQLALAAMLMALHGDGPIIIIAPKTLLFQWQEEMLNLLDMPSAVWDSIKKQWIDENGIEHPTSGHEGIRKCPRRVGIVSSGLIIHQSETVEYLKNLRCECVIVDEAHNARRQNRHPRAAKEKANPNNLLKFLYEIAFHSKSVLLATATPVQLYPFEAWDLLEVLSQGTDTVMGNLWSQWRQQVPKALDIVMGIKPMPTEGRDLWQWIRNPLPPAEERREFDIIRRTLNFNANESVATGSDWNRLRPADQDKILRMSDAFGQHHNPFIRHIIRRTRNFLENTINPADGQPYMQKIEVRLFGEQPEESIPLPPYLDDAYKQAKKFCQLQKERSNGSGFMETLLLRRVGSTIYAGRNTAERILEGWDKVPEAAMERDEAMPMRSLTSQEESCLRAFVSALEANKEQDPKYLKVVEYLLNHGWLERGCIIFSEYFESIWWLAQQLSSRDIPNEPIGIYASREKSGIFQNNQFTTKSREDLKAMVRRGELRLLLGTESASEGLNLQRLSTLINLDLPWNPTRLEQRKGRIQRIGQRYDTIYIYNMRYRGSVEERVHELLSERLESIHSLFGQLPDTLESAWIQVAMDEIEDAKQTIDEVPEKHPFEMRYEQIESINWESCAEVLAAEDRRNHLLQGWK